MGRNTILISLTALAVGVGCGPAGPPSLEGFGSAGDTDGPGDGDPGDGDPGDGDPGDGDGDPNQCSADYALGSQAPAFLEGYLDVDDGSRIDVSCFGDPDAAESIISWTAPESGEYWAFVEGDFTPELLVDVGSCDPNGLLDCAPPFEPLFFYAEAGQDYTFVIQDLDSFGGYWFLSIEPNFIGPQTCPDDFIEPFLPAQWLGETAEASNEFASECGGEDAPDRSYFFIPEITGIYRLDTAGSTYDTVVHVFEGECAGPMIGCNDDAPGGGLQSQVDFEMFSGLLYTIVIDGFGTSSGNFVASLTLEVETGCPDASFLPAQAPVVEQWILGDSPMAMPMYSCGPNGGQRRFVWEAPAPGDFRFSTSGSEAPTSLFLFDGLCEDGNAIDCQAGPPPGGASIERFVGGGEIVDIIVTHQYNAGMGQLRIEPVAPPPMCSPTPLMDPLPLQIQGTTQGPSNYSGTCGDGGGNAPEAVYSFTAPTAATYRFATNGSLFDTILYLRDQNCSSEIACDDDGGPGLTSRIDRQLAQGQTVTIFVDGFGQDEGNYTLSVAQL